MARKLEGELSRKLGGRKVIIVDIGEDGIKAMFDLWFFANEDDPKHWNKGKFLTSKRILQELDHQGFDIDGWEIVQIRPMNGGLAEKDWFRSGQGGAVVFVKYVGGGKETYMEADAKSKPGFKSLDKAMWDAGRTPNGKRQNESDEGGSDHPRIYVGTYAKYNNGSIDGKWIDISEYNTYEEFVDACRELHSDEDDPEFMVQDYENFPRKWYHEGGLPTEEEFNKINDYYLMDDTEQRAYEAYVNYTDDDDIDNFHEAYEGQFDSASDFAYDLVDNLGWEGIGSDNLDMYFDYDSFGRDLMFDFHIGDEDNEDSEGNPEDPDHYYDNDGYDMGEYESDDQVARDYIDGLGGVDQLGPDTARNYFDYEAFGRDLCMNDYFEEDGFVFRHI